MGKFHSIVKIEGLKNQKCKRAALILKTESNTIVYRYGEPIVHFGSKHFSEMDMIDKWLSFDFRVGTTYFSLLRNPLFTETIETIETIGLGTLSYNA